MKYIIIGLLLFSYIPGFTYCDYSHFTVYPKSPVITANSIFIFEVSYRCKHIIDSIGTKHFCFLESESDTIMLVPQESYTGNESTFQLILKPEKNLQVGDIYRLNITNTSYRFKSKLKRKDKQTGQRVQLNWAVTEAADYTPPVISLPPKFIESKHTFYGCGPEKYSSFEIQTNEKSEYLLFVEFVELQTNRTTRYYIKQKNNILYVGHSMCGGAFTFLPDKQYKFRYNIVDSAGNKSPTSGWVDCPNPTNMF